MRFLIDTHSLIWWLLGDPRLSRAARAALAKPQNRVFVSAMSICEITIKLSINKLPSPTQLSRGLLDAVDAAGFMTLPVTMEHAYAIRTLPWHHRDPFDRLLIAQSRVEGLTIVTNCRAIRSYHVDVLW